MATVEDTEGETCVVAVAFTEFDTVLLVVVGLEAAAKIAVPKQATPPSLYVFAVVPKGHELKQVFPNALLLLPQAAQSLLGAFPATI